ncbi:MAG TPA: hypothetical protein VHP11_17550 [Tepidisphaeraceae bacterium]|nr:hypothetical protein [Tepidisphaeraceae bacterium]
MQAGWTRGNEGRSLASRRKHSGRRKWSREDVRNAIAELDEAGTNETIESTLMEIVENDPDAGADLAWLAAYDSEQKNGASFALALLFRGIQDEGPLSPAQRRRLRIRAKEVIEAAMPDMNVPDDRKLMLVPLYHMLGGDVKAEEVSGYFQDYAGSLERMSDRMLSDISDRPDSIEQVLEGFNIFDREGEPPSADSLATAATFAVALAQKDPAAAGALAGSMAAIAGEFGVESEIVPELLKAVATMGNARTAWYLDELSRWPAIDVSELAGELAREMKGRGLAPRHAMIGEFSHGMVSMEDGVGSRSLTLFFRTPEGGMDSLIVMLNRRVGMKDVWCAFEDSTEIEETVHATEQEIKYAPCKLELARELIADAWALHEREGRPLPGRFFIYRPFLGEQPIQPRTRTPNLGAYMLEMMVVSPDLAKGSEELLDHPAYVGRCTQSEEAFAYVREHMSGRKKKKSQGSIEEFIQRFISHDKEAILAGMAANLEVESLAGRATQPVNQLAARTYVAIRDGVCPLEQIPYIYGIAEECVDDIRANIAMGYKSQAEANAAAAELGELLGGLSELFEDDPSSNRGW